MSTPPIAPDNVEQVRRQIQRLAAEIEALSVQELPASSFWGEFLRRLVDALSAMGGAVWLRRSRRLELVYQIQFPADEVGSVGAAREQHSRLLERVVSTGQAVVLPPRSGETDAQGAANPTHSLLVLVPIVAAGEIEGLVEVFQRPGASPQAQDGYRRFTEQMCHAAARWVIQTRLQEYRQRQSLWPRADDFTRRIHESLDLRSTLYDIVNESRPLIECDRVSIALRRGSLCRIEAISGVDTLESRSHVIRLMSELATRVVATGEPLWFAGEHIELPPQLREPLDRFLQETDARTLAVLPLFPPPPRGSDEAARAHREPVGALIVEQIRERRAREELERRLELVVPHAERALANALRHSQVFLLPLWTALGRARWLIAARNLPRTVAVLAVVTAAVLFLTVTPGRFVVRLRGTLEPATLRQVYSPANAVVVSAAVPSGQSVAAGDLLLELQCPGLDDQIAAAEAQLQAISEQLRAVEGEPGEPSRDAERQRLRSLSAALVRRLETHRQLQQQLHVRAPIAGSVIAAADDTHWEGRPVAAGQPLLKVVDLAGAWQLQLHAPEEVLAHVSRAHREQKGGLAVDFVRLADSTERRQATVHDLPAWVEPLDGSRYGMRIRADVAGVVRDAHPGDPVVARIDCGRRSLGYIWFHELIDFLRIRSF